jgi:hypothetical protein
MRGTLFLLATAVIAVSAVPPKDTALPKDAAAPKKADTAAAAGVGTGITKAIAPPGEQIPKDCVSDYAGNFGIAVEMAPIWTPFRNVDDGSMGSNSNMQGLDEMDFASTGSGSNVGVAPKAPSPKQPGSGSAVAPAAAGMSGAAAHGSHDMAGGAKAVVSGVMRAPAAALDEAGPDVTVTVRATRFTTKTYTVSKIGSAVPKPAKYDAAAGNVVKAAVIRQIGDGQIQMPHIQTEITLKPTASAFAPLSSGAPRISQIGDGQVQNIAPASAKPAVYQSSPKATSAPAPAKVAAPPAAAAPPPAAAAAPASPAMAGMDHGGHSKLRKRQTREFCPKKDTLGMTLKGSVLKDKLNRIGYAAGNMQFQ